MFSSDWLRSKWSTKFWERPYFQRESKLGISPFQNMVAYLGGSAFQTVVDNPITAYRQLVQQYAKDLSVENS